tara:strand:+ start:17 stop:352 length:336 start_codon:yes stop_codon:yes gene_type:complete
MTAPVRQMIEDFGIMSDKKHKFYQAQTRLIEASLCHGECVKIWDGFLTHGDYTRDELVRALAKEVEDDLDFHLLLFEYLITWLGIIEELDRQENGIVEPIGMGGCYVKQDK